MKSLFVAWRLDSLGRSEWRPIGRLEHDGELYRFCYTKGARKPDFRPFPRMEDLEQVYESEELLPIFSSRLLSRSRPEYEAYLRWSGFDPAQPPDPIAILGVTEGIRQTDAIEVFPCPAPDAAGGYFNKFFLHGIRWMPPAAHERISRLTEGERLLLMPDLQNQHDRRAVAVRTDSEPMLIGFFPRYLANDMLQLVTGCDPSLIEVSVDRVNRDAPMQNRLLCRVHACWPTGFEPCRGEDFEPIPAAVSADCGA